MFAQAQAMFATAWEAEMGDTVTIERTTKANRGTFNETTGNYDSGTPTEVYTGQAQVHRMGAAARRAEFGEERIDVVAFYVRIPVAETGPDSGDQITVDACPGDAMLVGKVLELEHIRGGTHATRRELVAVLEEGTNR